MSKENGKTTMYISESGLNDKREFEEIMVNGVRYQVQRGVDVEVPTIVKEIYDESRANFKKGNTQTKNLVIEG